MKILLICEAVFPENKGGLERWMNWLGAALTSRGHDVTYLNAAGVNETRNGTKFISASKDQWHYVDDGKRSIFQSVRFAYAIRPKVKEINPTVIYSVQAPIFSIFALHFFRPFKYILIVEWIEIWSKKYWRNYLGAIAGRVGYRIQTFATKLGDLRVVFSTRCLKQLGGASEKNILLPGLHMPSANMTTNIFSIRENITFLGRFVAEKQPILAVEVARSLREMGWTGQLNIVGSGPLLQKIIQAVEQSNASEYISIFENANQETLAKCLEHSFLLIHPSKREGYGLAMIEAAERNIPTLLIDYPENASVDLGISPQYVLKSENPIEIAKVVFQAKSQQFTDWKRLEKWNQEKLPTMNAEHSVEALLAEVRKLTA